MEFTITPECVEGVCVGEVFEWNGNNYRIQKKTSSVISVTRYYWFDALFDWIARRMIK